MGLRCLRGEVKGEMSLHCRMRGIEVFSNQSVSFWVSKVGDSVLLWTGCEEERETTQVGL